LQAASTGDIHETIRLANVVYDKAQQMCKCHLDKAAAVVAVAPAAATVEKKAAVPKKEAAVEKKAETAAKVAAIEASAPKVVKAQVAADAKVKASAPASALNKLEKAGVVNPAAAKTANKLPLDTAKEFAKKVKKEEAKSLDDPIKTLKSEKKEADKAEAEQLEVKKKADLQKAKAKANAAAIQAAKDGKDPKPIVKKIMAQANKKAMEAEAKGAAKASPAAIKQSKADVKKKTAEEERDNVAKMTKALPKGVGLQSAFEKIEAQKLSAVRKDEKRKVEKAAAKELEGTVNIGQKELTSEAKAALNAASKKKSQAAGKALAPQDAAAKKLEKEEEKIEDTKSPAKAGDKAMFGKSEKQLAKEELTTKQKSVSKAAQAKDAKDAKAAEAQKQTDKGTGASEVEML